MLDDLQKYTIKDKVYKLNKLFSPSSSLTKKEQNKVSKDYRRMVNVVNDFLTLLAGKVPLKYLKSLRLEGDNIDGAVELDWTLDGKDKFGYRYLQLHFIPEEFRKPCEPEDDYDQILLIFSFVGDDGEDVDNLQVVFPMNFDLLWDEKITEDDETFLELLQNYF